MPPSLVRRLSKLVRDLRQRRVFRAALVYGTAAYGSLGLLDLLRDLSPWLDRAFPVLVLSAIFAFPVVLVAAWVFELAPGGIRLHRDSGAAAATLGYRLGATGAGILASLVFGWTVMALWARSENRRAEDPPVAEAAGGPAPTRLAVLYFDDHSPDGDLEYLANGLTEDLINALVAVDALEVTSRNGVKPFRESAPGTLEISRILNVGTLVEGSVTGDGERVRATVQLIDARTDEHIWSQQFDAPRGNVLALQDQLTQAMASTLREELGISIRTAEARSGTSDPEAWARYQEAQLALDEGREIAGRDDRLALPLYARADSLLQVAEALDPDWPDPTVLRGWVALRSSIERSERPGYLQPEDSARLMAAAERAVAESDQAAAALELRGVVLWEIGEAAGRRDDVRAAVEADLLEAVRLDPRSAKALTYLSTVRRVTGDFGGARLFAERAIAADAFHEEAEEVIATLYDAYLELRELDQADEWCRTGRRRFPDNLYFGFCRLFLMAVDPQRADPDAAWSMLDTLRAEAPPEPWSTDYRPWAGFQVARVLALAGLPDSARAVLAEYRPAPGDRAWFGNEEAAALLALGDAEGALDALAAHLEVRPDRKAYVRSDWLFEDLWDDPRFLRLTEVE